MSDFFKQLLRQMNDVGIGETEEEAELPVEARRANEIIEKVELLSGNDPESVVNIIRGWLSRAPATVQKSGLKKAAIVLVALGSGTSAKIFQKLNNDEVEKLITEIARLECVTPEVLERVLEEFHHLTIVQQFVNQGGMDYAREVLEAALGPVRAKETLLFA